MRGSAWLLCSLFAVVAWGLWGFLSKLVSGHDAWELHPHANHVASTLGLIGVLGLSWLARGRLAGAAPDTGKGWRGLVAGLAGGILGSAGNILLYAAYARGGLATVVSPLTGIYPLGTVVLSMALLRERLGGWHVAGIPLSLVAALLLGADSAGSLRRLVDLELVREPWYLLAWGAILAWGASGFLQKVATLHVAPHAATVAFAGGYVVVAVYCLLAGSFSWGVQSGTALLVGLAAGLLNGLGLVGLFAALGRGGKASVVVPLTGLYPVVTVALAVACLGERPGLVSWLGVALALAAGALLAREGSPEGGDS